MAVVFPCKVSSLNFRAMVLDQIASEQGSMLVVKSVGIHILRGLLSFQWYLNIQRMIHSTLKLMIQSLRTAFKKYKSKRLKMQPVFVSRHCCRVI
jgi:hypothetical protein